MIPRMELLSTWSVDLFRDRSGYSMGCGLSSYDDGWNECQV